jgi:diguanylate cyclase (GGDEF)-like protein/putative nucleotidyltransferase with HDIG domain
MESRRDAPPAAAPEASERLLTQSTRVLRLARELALSADSSTIARLVARHVGELSGGGPTAVYLLDPEAMPVHAAAAGFYARQPLRPPRVVVRALAESRLVSAAGAELPELEGYGASCREAFAAPIAAGGEVFGALLVGVPSGGHVGIHPSLLVTVTELAGASLANARRLAETHAEARSDPLTELGNHRAFQEHVDRALLGAHGAGGAITLVLFDLDDFKRLNDDEGHPAGDRVLRDFARTLREHCRAGEEPFRVGGDEFAVVVDGEAAAGVQLAERIRRAAAQHLVGSTLSAGVASFPADAPSKEELVGKADLALIAAKRAGKDMAITFADDGEGGASRTSLDLLYRELRERMGEGGFRDVALRELWNAGRALGRERTQEGMLKAAAKHLAVMLRATACLVSRITDGALVGAADFAHAPWRLDTGGMFLLEDYPETQHVLESHAPSAVALSDDEVDESEAFVLRRLGMHAVLMLPLHVRGRPWGLVEVYDARERSFDAADTALAELLVGHLEVLLAQFEHAEAVERLYRETLASLTSALEAKDDYTSAHAQEVSDLAVDVARRLGLDDELVQAIELGALLHDIGKIRIPESILNKPSALDDEEWTLMRTHPVVGERILAPIEALAGVVPIVRSSHERWDGGGYPDGLRAEEIPIGARIVAVCDAFRAMVEPRPYWPARPVEAACVELERNAGTQFDPAAVTALLRSLDARHAGLEEYELWRPDHLVEAAS